MSPEAALVIDLLIAGVLLALAAMLRRHEGSWLAPGAFFCAIWALTFVICLVLAPDFPVHPLALLWILLGGVAAGVGSLIGTSDRRSASSAPQAKPSLAGGTSVILTATLLGFAAVGLLFQWGGGAAFGSDFGEALIAVAVETTERRYSGEGEPWLAVLMISVVYFGCMASGGLAGLAQHRNERPARLVLLAPFVPGLAVSVLLTTKASIVFCVAFWLAAYFAARVSRRADDIRPGRAGLVIIVGVPAGVAAIVALTAWRYRTELAELPTLVPTIRVSLLGSLSAFATWFAAEAQAVTPSLGLVTFAGLASWFGLPHRAMGVFESSVDVGGSHTNVYTAFRFLIEDFSIPGALAILGLAAFGFGLAFRRARAGNASASAILASFYLIVIMSPITMATTYNSVLFAFALYWGYLTLGARSASTRFAQRP